MRLPPASYLDFASQPVPTPPSREKYVKRDKKRVFKILKFGHLPPIDWAKTKERFDRYLIKLLGRPVESVFINVTAPEDEDGPSSQEEIGGRPINLDDRMNKSVVACVVHNEHLVLVATFSTDVCREIAEIATQATGLDYCLSGEALDGIKKIGNEDSMQAAETAVYTANFGATIRPQRSTLLSISKYVQRFDNAIGGARGGQVTCPLLSFSPTQAVSPMYHKQFHAVFKDKRLRKRDRWYGVRTNGKRRRIPRFSAKGRTLDKRTTFKVFHPMRCSFPSQRSNPCLIAVAEAECRIRNLSEWILLNAFAPLPYAHTGTIAADNIRSACEYAQRHSLSMPCSSLARPLPKGAIGIQQCKELHDDGNAALIPGIWTSIRGDENVVLRFLGTNMNVYFKAADFRFCWFYGWVPHKTEIQPGAQVQQVSAEGKMGTVSRVHHSAFSKPELEHLGLVLFSKKHRKEVVKSYTHMVKSH